MIREVKSTNYFNNVFKKLYKKQRIEVEKNIIKIMENPDIGEEKKGDLKNIRIHKFKVDNDRLLLAYSFTGKSILLIALGSYENFYRDLKKHI